MHNERMVSVRNRETLGPSVVDRRMFLKLKSADNLGREIWDRIGERSSIPNAT